MEIAPKLGRAEYICDLVSTGGTLKANGLREVDVLLESEAVVIQTRKPLGDDKQALVDKILQRLDGVLQVRESKYIMLHAPKSALAEIRDLLPGSEAPTVLRLDGSDDKVAVHAVCILSPPLPLLFCGIQMGVTRGMGASGRRAER